MIPVSLNVGGVVRLIKPAKLCTCTQNTTNTTRTDARRRVCAAMVLYRLATRETSLRELEHTHTQHLIYDDGRTAPGVCGNGSVLLSHSGNVVTRVGIHIHRALNIWTDARCPVPRLWIRSPDVWGERR